MKKYIKYILIIAFLSLAGTFISSPQKAAAATTCSYGGSGSWVYSDVFVQVYNYKGVFQRYSTNFTFNVTATVPNPVYYSKWKKNITNPAYAQLSHAIRSGSGAAAGSSVNLTANSSNMDSCLVGASKHPAYDFTNGTNGNYYLDCLGAWTYPNYPTDPNRYNAWSASYTFKGISVNDAVPGGTWTVQTKKFSPSASNDLNTSNLSAVLEYKEPNAWAISGSTTPSPTAVQAGQTVNWNNVLKNNGPDPSDSYSYAIEWAPGTTGPGVTVGAQIDPTKASGVQAVTPSGNISYSYPTIIPSAATAGQKYCVRLTFINKSNLGGRGYGTTGCITVLSTPPTNAVITPSSAIVDNATGVSTSPVVVSTGSTDTFNFTHTIKNNGPANANYSWQVQYQANGGSWTNLAANSGTSSNVGLGNINHPNTVSLNSTWTSYCQRVTVTPSNANTTASAPSSTPVCINIVPIPTCSGVGITANTYIQPGDTGISVKLGFTGSGASSLVGSNIAYTVNGFTSGSSAISNLGSGLYGVSLTGLSAPPNPGIYAVSWNPSPQIVPALNCTGSISVVNLPTFNVYGASVSSGGEFKSTKSATSCNGGGELAGWGNNTGANYYGSSAHLAALALIKIVGFASAQTVSANGPTDLTFGNDIKPGNAGTLPTSDLSSDMFSPSLGGDLDHNGGSTSHCLTELQEPATQTSVTSPFSVAGAASHDDYFYDASTSALVIDNGGSQISPGTNVTLYVKGDVYIASNIEFNTGGWNSTNIPSFNLVVTGNIYISSGVSRLDGVYIARNQDLSVIPTATDGRIYTCSQLVAGVPGLIANASMFSTCNTQLVVYGSFIADQINLMRTYGTIKDSSNPPVSSCSNGAAPYTPSSNYSRSCSGEVFYFAPETFLTKPSGSSNNAGYDYIVSLPPVL